MRKLSADEQALWDKVAATIQPLSRDPATRATPPAPARPVVALSDPAAAAHRRAAAAVTPPVAAPTPVRGHFKATLDGGWDKRLSRGGVAPDRTIDLHGHRLDDAWHAIDQGIDRAIRAGDRLVLLITGHPPKGEPPVARGRIRAAVEGWLSASRHAHAIAAVRGAHPRHGGRGALYLILRRDRSR